MRPIIQGFPTFDDDVFSSFFAELQYEDAARLCGRFLLIMLFKIVFIIIIIIIIIVNVIIHFLRTKLSRQLRITVHYISH